MYFFDRICASLKTLARAPRFALMFASVLGLGVGAILIAGNINRAVVTAPLPFVEQDRLVRIRESRLPQFPNFQVASGKFLVWQQQSKTLQSMAMFRFQRLISQNEKAMERLEAAQVTAHYFQTLGAPLLAGRGFVDAMPEADLVILNESYARQRFGELDAIGRQISLNGRFYSVAGIVSALPYPNPKIEAYTLWRPNAEDANRIAQHTVHVIGRLHSGVSLEASRLELQRITEQVESSRGMSNDWQVEITPAKHDFLGAAASKIHFFAALTGLLCLAALSTLVTIFSLRLQVRHSEFALRRSLGATRFDLMATMLLESLALGLFGSLIALLVNGVGLYIVRIWAPPGLPRAELATMDGLQYAGAFALCFAFSVIVALLANALAFRKLLSQAPGSGVRLSASKAARFAGSLIIVSKIALAVALVTCTLVLHRYYARISANDPGFQIADTYFLQLTPSAQTYSSPDAIKTLYRALIDDISGIPGISSASVAQALPMERNWSLAFIVEGLNPADGEYPAGSYYASSIQHLRTLGIPIISGRSFNADDHAKARPVALISQRFARVYFHGQEPIGKRIRAANEREWREIIGIVGNVRQQGLAEDAGPQIYAPFEQLAFLESYIVLSAKAFTPELRRAVLKRIESLAPNTAAGGIKAFSQVVDQSLAINEFLQIISFLLALLATGLAGAGVYAAISHTVANNKLDFGVHMAFGASSGIVIARVLRKAMLLGCIGAGLGAIAMLLVLSSLQELIGNTPILWQLLIVMLAAVMLTTLAALFPAFKVAVSQPLTSLRAR